MTRLLAASDLRLGLRLMRKQPVLALAAVLALASGIGMATTGFTFLETLLFGRLPFPDGERFVLVEAYADPEARPERLGAERFRLLAESAPAFRHLGAFSGTQWQMQLASGEVVPVSTALLTPASFGVLPYRPLLGRTLLPADGEPGAPPTVLLRESLWRRHFGADPAVVGTAVGFSGVARTIVGVLPDEARFPGSSEAWAPLDPQLLDHRGRVFGVLAAGSSAAVAGEQVQALSRLLEAQGGGRPPLRLSVVPFVEAASRGLEVLVGAVVVVLVLVLVVIAANVASLILARSVSRSSELSVRAALGGGRGRLVAQITVEVALLAGLAAVLGLSGSRALLGWVERTATDLPFWIDLAPGRPTLAFVVAVTALATWLGGVVPALRATRRTSASDLAAARSAATAGWGRASTLLIGVQVALSIALLHGALVLARGVAGYRSAGLRAPTEPVLTARLYLEPGGPAAEVGRRQRAVVEAAEALPGVLAAGLATSLPGLSPPAEPTEVEAAPGEPPAAPRGAPVVGVRGEFFAALGATASAGRLFEAADFSPGAPPVAIVNEPFVRERLGGANPLGRRLRLPAAEPGGGEPVWREIVGVVPDLGLSAGDPAFAAGAYLPMGDDDFFYLALRAHGDPGPLGSRLRQALATLDPGLQIRDLLPLAQVGAEDRAIFAGIGAGLAALGGMALGLSVIGIYALFSFTVTRRTREIGIRTALGATPGRILRAVLGPATLPLAGGALAGPLLAGLFVQARGIFAFRLPAGSGPWGPPALAALLVVAALAAAWAPSRRALRVPPAAALRSE